jgi:hypothetical protein
VYYSHVPGGKVLSQGKLTAHPGYSTSMQGRSVTREAGANPDATGVDRRTAAVAQSWTLELEGEKQSRKTAVFGA